MTFGRWVLLEEAAEEAPREAGVVQLRVAHGTLLEYPRGKSAMIHYTGAADLRECIAGLAATHRGRGWLCRHTLEMSAKEHDDVEAAAAHLVSVFVSRFGCPPQFPDEARRD